MCALDEHAGHLVANLVNSFEDPKLIGSSGF